jgi:hypothetical protein
MDSSRFNLNQNDSFSDEELGLGDVVNGNKPSADLDAFSDMSSNDGDLGGRQQFDINMRPNRQPQRPQDDDARSTFSANSEQSVSSYAGSDLTPEEEEKKKIILLSKLKRLQKRGYTLSRAFNIDSALEDIQAEVDSIKREANLEAGTKVAKQWLVSVCSLLEYANNRFDPMDVVLDGWSEEINEDVENGDYDEVMEELYDKYYDKVQMSPEMKLMMMIGGSAVKFHISHTLLKSMVPGADTLLKQNPNLKNDIMNLVNQTDQGQAIQQQMNTINSDMMGGRQRQEMSGPDDVDDILAELENETNNAVANNQIMNQNNNGVVDISF